MEHWSAHNDKPYLRPEHNSHAIWWVVLVVLLVGAGVGVYVYWQHLARPSAPPLPPPPPRALSKPPPPLKPAPPAIQHPIAPPKPTEKPLPALAESDAPMQRALAQLVGDKPFAELFYPHRIILRIVATIDSLPRKSTAENMMPVKAVPGKFLIAGTEDHAVISPANAARYLPYVRIFEAVNARLLVDAYIHFYPLFQQAYVELGYPHGYFNDRLIQAIDNLLATPDVKGPIVLVRPKVLYEFADPTLQNLSAGQKIMLRMGRKNDIAVEAKLREIRQQLLAHSPQPAASPAHGSNAAAKP